MASPSKLFWKCYRTETLEIPPQTSLSLEEDSRNRILCKKKKTFLLPIRPPRRCGAPWERARNQVRRTRAKVSDETLSRPRFHQGREGGSSGTLPGGGGDRLVGTQPLMFSPWTGKGGGNRRHWAGELTSRPLCCLAPRLGHGAGHSGFSARAGTIPPVCRGGRLVGLEAPRPP